MIKSILLAGLLAGISIPASATVLVLNSGWNGDDVSAAGVPSSNSPLTFTLTADAFFRVTDAFAVGDIYTVTDSGNNILAQTAFLTDGAAVEDYFGTAWSDTSYSRLSLLLGAGSYSFSIAGDCAGGCPAGFAVRLDSVSQGSLVPEPESWALMIAGFGLVGAVMRRRARSVAA